MAEPLSLILKNRFKKRMKRDEILIISLTLIGLASFLTWFGYLTFGIFQNSKPIIWETPITGVINDLNQYKGFTYILLEQENEYWKIDSSSNHDYSEPFIADFLRKGDFLEKSKCSDTLYIIRDNQKFHFLIGDQLYNSKTRSKEFIEYWRNQRRIITEKSDCK
ncbi:hypothetical protein R3X28_00010 [Maribacter sp. TH_r10]|uniref:hypothetical protein n=1 Tax=Maribacter sp. TH_r10 TaxID=3082086 RepID=UPI0029542A4B|nr:hypothetical protein [Maribacter sp. TH_r10]MDV7137233.1 hypothetical protein [Maribacter sp. TH_r10]